jgi:lincosamide nucleotidyltransferase A/C/D/E
MITPRAVASLLTCLEAHGISFWLDGGVGVDALVGGWTREHSDLDLVIPLAQAAEARRTLGTLGMTQVTDELPTRLVVADGGDRSVDLHTVTFDDEGGGTQELPGGRSFRYPPEGFAGVGWLEGRAWPCLTAEVQVRCHVGYDPDATDYHDMRRLHERFGVPLPAPYAGHGDARDAGE